MTYVNEAPKETSNPKHTKKRFLNINIYHIQKPAAKTHQETIFKHIHLSDT